jgi:hypothetical protein
VASLKKARKVLRFYPEIVLPILATTGLSLALEGHHRVADLLFLISTFWGIGLWAISDQVANAKAKSRRRPERRATLSAEQISEVMLRKRREYRTFLWRLIIPIALLGALAIGTSEYFEYQWELRQNFGELKPARDPMPPPPSACSGEDIPKDETRIYGGDSIAIVNPSLSYSLVKIGGEPIIWMNTTPKGILVSGNLYTPDGNLVNLDNNHFETAESLSFKPRRPDRSTLIVLDKWHHTVLDIRFLNEHAIRVKGTFFKPGYPPVVISDTGIYYKQALLKGNCNLSTHYAGFLSIGEN